MNPEIAQAHAEIIKVILGYSFLAFFIATGLITLLALVGIVKLVERKFLNRLFVTLVVEIVGIGLAAVSGFLSLDTRRPVNHVETVIQKKDATIAEKTSELKTIVDEKDKEHAQAIQTLMPLASEGLRRQPNLAIALAPEVKTSIRSVDSKSYLALNAAAWQKTKPKVPKGNP